MSIGVTQGPSPRAPDLASLRGKVRGRPPGRNGIFRRVWKKMDGKKGIRNGRANTECSLTRLLNRLPSGIERTHINRARTECFSLLIRWGCWRNGLESADGKGRERKLCFGDLAVVVEI